MVDNTFISDSRISRVIIQNLTCDGTETDIQQCMSSPWKTSSSCTTEHTAAINCSKFYCCNYEYLAAHNLQFAEIKSSKFVKKMFFYFLKSIDVSFISISFLLNSVYYNTPQSSIPKLLGDL